MKFESLTRNTTKDFEPKEITPNVTQVSKNSFESKLNIDGLEHTLSLDRRSRLLLTSKHWYLSFNVEDTTAVTNKGLLVFNQIVDRLEELVTAVSGIEKIDAIEFLASGTRLKLEDVLTFTKLLEEKFETSPEAFDGFVCDIMGSETAVIGQFSIQNGQAVKTLSNYKVLGVPETETIPLEDFLQSNGNINSLLEGRLDAQKLLDHLNIEHTVTRPNFRSRDGSEGRTKLYERVLKQRFPQYSLETRGEAVIIHLV